MQGPQKGAGPQENLEADDKYEGAGRETSSEKIRCHLKGLDLETELTKQFKGKLEESGCKTPWPVCAYFSEERLAIGELLGVCDGNVRGKLP